MSSSGQLRVLPDRVGTSLRRSLPVHPTHQSAAATTTTTTGRRFPCELSFILRPPVCRFRVSDRRRRLSETRFLVIPARGSRRWLVAGRERLVSWDSSVRL